MSGSEKRYGRPRDTVDMAVQPASYEYRPPEGRECEDYEVPLGGRHSLHITQCWYHGRVVWFAITQRYLEAEGEYSHVYRIDCCHGEVHSHQYFRDSDEQRRVTIERITDRSTAWDTVDRLFDHCNDLVISDAWEERVRVWERRTPCP